MGADLICYIAFGPDHIDIDDQKVSQVAGQVRRYLDACIAAAEKVLLGKKHVPRPRQAPIQAKCSVTLYLGTGEQEPLPSFNTLEEVRSHPDYRGLIRRVLADCEHEAESEYVFDVSPEAIASEVRGFVAGWNKGGFGDMAARPDPARPGRKVVVAGQMSHGDEPDGQGYQLLKKAFGLGIAQLLGVS